MKNLNEPTNEDRVAAAEQVLNSHQKYRPVDEDSVVDLIADLLHYAKQKSMAPNLAERAQMHFEAESSEEG